MRWMQRLGDAMMHVKERVVWSALELGWGELEWELKWPTMYRSYAIAVSSLGSVNGIAYIRIDCPFIISFRVNHHVGGGCEDSVILSFHFSECSFHSYSVSMGCIFKWFKRILILITGHFLADWYLRWGTCTRDVSPGEGIQKRKPFQQINSSTFHFFET